MITVADACFWDACLVARVLRAGFGILITVPMHHPLPREAGPLAQSIPPVARI
jgi:hypothetical protein